jgi:transposase-like protein
VLPAAAEPSAVADANSARRDEDHNATLYTIYRTFGDVRTTDEVIDLIRADHQVEPTARYRRAVRARGHFPTEQAALKCLYLATRSLDPTRRGRAKWAVRCKPALNAFAITFEG